MIDLRLKEIYSNLKNYDWYIFPSYKMDKAEAKKYCEAIEDMEQGGWILCSERLPEFDEEVLVVTMSQDVCILYLTHSVAGDVVWKDNYVDCYRSSGIIAWQPLPTWKGDN